jgi:hypothetical protein
VRFGSSFDVIFPKMLLPHKILLYPLTIYIFKSCIARGGLMLTNVQNAVRFQRVGVPTRTRSSFGSGLLVPNSGDVVQSTAFPHPDAGRRANTHALRISARCEMYRQALVSPSPNVHPLDGSSEYSDSRRLPQNNNCGNPASELSQHGDKCTVDDG